MGSAQCTRFSLLGELVTFQVFTKIRTEQTASGVPPPHHS